MNDISPLGWVILGLLALFLVVLNLSLFTAWRDKKKGRDKDSNSPFQGLEQSIRKPWKKEDEMLSELARRAAELRRKSDSSQDSKDDSK
ncbi:hypothetical protein LARV_02139 [Longilinea arvoryzae]|uniref:Uncharacterized protein n=1 Tax=Longilinea arvoryzae TaxID=360412 RepID=A0A0S7BIG9_9CHLR|nr:hypothetical protein LARV_02139 [Longilinea arvoryzae]